MRFVITLILNAVVLALLIEFLLRQLQRWHD